MSRVRRSDPHHIAELERRLRVEDERRELIERATTPAELDDALAYGKPEPSVRPVRPLGDWAGIAATLFAVLVVIFFAAGRVGHAAGSVDWASVSVGTDDPFADAPTNSTVYIVPLDRQAWDNDGGFSLAALRDTIRSLKFSVVVTPPLVVGPEDFETRRRQLNGNQLESVLANRFQRYESISRRSVVIGVTSLDQYSPTFFGERFSFMTHGDLGRGGVAVISTARMSGTAALERQRLWKMTLRAIGFYVLHRPRTADWSVMHDPIRSLDDLDRLNAVFDQPAHTEPPAT